MSICPVYTGKKAQRKYSIEQWYRKQIKDRITNNSNTTKEQNWEWFKHTNYWKQSTFHEYWRQIKANKPIPSKPQKKPPTSYNKQKQIALNISNILFAYNYNDNIGVLIEILNIISKQITAPLLLQKFNLGDCLLTILEIFKSMHKMGNAKDHITLKQKQILLTSMMSITSDDGYDSDDCNYDPDIDTCSIHNTALLYTISPSYKNLKYQILQNKFDFVHCDDPTLYNTDIDEKTREVYPSEIFESIDKYLIETTCVNPNKYLNRKVLNKQTGKKEDHPYQWADTLFKELYIDWIAKHITLFRNLNLSSIPSKSLFDERRREYHPYIYKRPKNDYGNCQIHFNTKQQIAILCTVLNNQYIHTCHNV